ncbi:hypothetical protein I315_02457 [Cryptococcus gattii Ru294]|uniref:Uncharacterized protein n=2 Tax=Cryptococcus gattii TaxID=37769 RepID=E6RD64_CRYGW|nr:Hypothetical Protein CGB_K0500W [Cryptococcus gattii WM276]KIR55219.1 hypothetical protein I315_02457 [Cryptococcus gattii Ru294]KIR79238.1 hypothetical protein I306_03657 [Cryptococcus gattii EJB2]KIY35171.1 hypothetical protein I305_02077 [Cryptococcus gattii E566]KJE05635.1 hypothetical protein I311_00360 [Cryptococcus gattii NT-10]ADV24750.1 Hypothetical Protein CGB_K0500W [Cryptococcus gattii WM276]
MSLAHTAVPRNQAMSSHILSVWNSMDPADIEAVESAMDPRILDLFAPSHP